MKHIAHISQSIRGAAEGAMKIALKTLLRGSSTARDALIPKGDRDFATAVDFEIEDAVRAHFQHATPDIVLLGEERGGADLTQKVFWTLDPIDGTVNYSRKVPLCGISLALVVEGVAVLAMVDLPFIQESYRAERGMGTTLNGTSVHVSQVRKLSNALVAVGDYAVTSTAETTNKSQYRAMELLSDQVLRVRMYGSAAVDLAWLAAGKIDASISLNNNAWDVQAGGLLVREAGLRVGYGRVRAFGVLAIHTSYKRPD